MAWINHLLSLHRTDRDSRHNEASFWREYADDLANAQSRRYELFGVVTALTIPDPAKLVAEFKASIDQLRTDLRSLRARNRRAPEPLTAHVRLLLQRIDRAASDTTPFDWEVGKRAIRDFRLALDYYVRTGRSMRLPLEPGEMNDDV